VVVLMSAEKMLAAAMSTTMSSHSGLRAKALQRLAQPVGTPVRDSPAERMNMPAR
jgi:hypothetical protein